MATLLVIITHSIQIITSAFSGTKGYLLTVLSTVTLSCNYLFVMLSGSLHLRFKEEPLGKFYVRKFSSVLLPLIVYALFYFWVNRANGSPEPTLTEAFTKIIAGEFSPEAPHFHLFYTIASLYVAYPFLRYMFKDMPYRTLTNLCIVIIVFLCFQMFTPKPALSTFLIGWVGLAILGYWVTRRETAKYYNFLIILGIVQIGIIFYLCVNKQDFLNIIYNNSPIMSLLAVGEIATIFKFKNVFSKHSALLTFISRRSYSILLIHWYVQKYIVMNGLHISAAYWHGLGMIISPLLTLLISIVMAFAFDNLFLLPIQSGFDRAVKAIQIAYANIKKKRID